MKIVNIKAYKYEELSEDAQDSFVAYMYDYPFDCENNEGEFEIEFFDAIKPKDYSSKNKLSKKLNTVLEIMIRRNPNQWIWSHNRWK